MADKIFSGKLSKNRLAVRSSFFVLLEVKKHLDLSI